MTRPGVCGIACVIIAAGAWLLTGSLSAQTVATTHYSVSAGLPHLTIKRIVQDSRGFTWFATLEGLSRFDGYRFRNYSTADGLPHLIVNDVAEDRQGHLWIATNGGGIARLLESADSRSQGKRFATYRVGETAETNQVNALASADDGSLWCVTDAGLFRGRPSASLEEIAFEKRVPYTGPLEPMQAFVDRSHRLWFTMHHELIEVDADRISRFGPEAGWGNEALVSVTESPDGDILVATQRSLFKVNRTTDVRKAFRLNVETTATGAIRVIRTMPDAQIWIGGTEGLAVWDGSAARRIEIPGLRNVGTIVGDSAGGAWVGSDGGAEQLPAERVLRFSGLSLEHLFADRSGRVFGAGPGTIREFSQSGAQPIPGFPGSTPHFRLSDSRGDVWGFEADPDLIARYKPGTATRQVEIRRDDSFRGFNPVFHEDAAGRVWISVAQFLYRYDPSATQPWQRYELPGGFFRMSSASDGSIWLGSFGDLARFRNGVSTPIKPTTNLPDTMVRALHVDTRGWLWVGLRTGGVSVSRNPGETTPAFDNYSTSRGLGSDSVWSITEDRFGRMYFGHGRGIDRLDPIAESVEHLRLPDDVQGSPVFLVVTDTTGNLWFVANHEAQRLAIRPPENAAPGPVLIDRIELSGEDFPVSERGATAVALPDLPGGRNALRIEYVGLGFAAAGVRYQYSVDTGNQSWSKPTDERSVNFANFAPQSYRFAVRGIDRNGRTGPEAIVTFVVPAPLWLRPWFVATGLGVFVALGFGWHRLRLRHVLAVERIRRQVALDLHDDVGAGLTRIAMLSDLSARDNSVKRSGEIGTLARSLRESMSDIVWAIDPRHDHVVDLARRIRQVAFHLEESSGLPIHLNITDEQQLSRIGLAADRRRHLLLILKETLTNAVRHARASAIHVDLLVEAGELRLTVRDDGQGFDPEVRHPGHGLDNLRTRAEQMGGLLQVVSGPGSGTSVTVAVRLG